MLHLPCIRLAKKSNNPDALKLNYKYRLYPTETQAFHLGRSMRRATHWWNNLCKGYRHAKEIIRRGHASRLRADLVKSIRDKGDTGQRAPKLTKMMEELGRNREAAQAKLCQTDIDKIFAFKDYKRPDGTVVRKPAMSGNVLAVRWSIARVTASNDQSESGLSKAFNETTERYGNTWAQFWRSRREPNKPPAGKPRKKRVGTDALSIGYQNQAKNDAIILKQDAEKGFLTTRQSGRKGSPNVYTRSNNRVYDVSVRSCF
ncbi:MAG: helix-turn-helix domain-containing protein [Bryobacteraceae bacterium]